jgi:hypothetical protein
MVTKINRISRLGAAQDNTLRRVGFDVASDGGDCLLNGLDPRHSRCELIHTSVLTC